MHRLHSMLLHSKTKTQFNKNPIKQSEYCFISGQCLTDSLDFCCLTFLSSKSMDHALFLMKLLRNNICMVYYRTEALYN